MPAGLNRALTTHHIILNNFCCDDIAMFLVTSPIVINVPTRGLLAVETMHAIVRWLANLNIKRNMTSMFVNKKHRYNSAVSISVQNLFSRLNIYIAMKYLAIYTEYKITFW